MEGRRQDGVGSVSDQIGGPPIAIVHGRQITCPLDAYFDGRRHFCEAIFYSSSVRCRSIIILLDTSTPVCDGDGCRLKKEIEAVAVVENEGVEASLSSEL